MSTSPGRGGLLPAVRSRFTAAHPDAVLRLRHVSREAALVRAYVAACRQAVARG